VKKTEKKTHLVETTLINNDIFPSNIHPTGG